MKNVKKLQFFHFFGHFSLKCPYLKIMTDFFSEKLEEIEGLKYGMDDL